MRPDDNRDFLELVAFLLVSSRNLVSEPPRYGPLRLVEAARRLIEVLEERGLATAFLRDIASAAGEMPAQLMRSEDEFVQSLDSIIGTMAERLAALT